MAAKNFLELGVNFMRHTATPGRAMVGSDGNNISVQ